MATEVLKITNNDDMSILHATPVALKSGTTKSDAITVEDYTPSSKIIIDLSQDDADDADADADADAEIITRKGKRIYKGESSNSQRRVKFTCEICTDDKPMSESFLIIGCDHSYCTECISNYVAAKLQENITTITCPVPRCGGYLEPHHCRTILPKEVFDRWGDMLCEAMILGTERFYCPYKDCSAPLVNDGGHNEAVVVQSECPDCHRLFCAPCKAAWHAGIHCEEFQKLRADERNSEDIMLINLAKSKKWIRCPKCNIYVSKIAGCSYIVCRCRHMFCYGCGGVAHSDRCYKRTRLH